MSQQLLEGRWDETKEALLEGLNGSKRTSMNVILENTRRYLKKMTHLDTWQIQYT